MLRSVQSLGVIALLTCSTVCAQDAATKSALPTQDQPKKSAGAPDAQELTVDFVEQKLKRVATLQVDDAAKAALTALYEEALDGAKALEQFTKSARTFEERTKEAPQKLVRVKEELARPLAETKPSIDPKLPAEKIVESLEAQLGAVSGGLEAAKKEAAQLEIDHSRRNRRRPQLPELIGNAQQRIEDVRKQFSEITGNDPSDELQTAKRTVLRAKIRSARAELESLQAESAYHEATGELLTAERDAATRRAAHAQKGADLIRQALNQYREKAAAEAIQAARSQAMVADSPGLQQLAQENADLAQEREKLLQSIGGIAKSKESVSKKLARAEEDLKSITEKLKSISNRGVLGLELRELRSRLPDVRGLRKNVRAREPEIDRVQYRRFELDQQRLSLVRDLDELARNLFLQSAADEERAFELKQQISEQLAEKRNHLSELDGGYDGYMAALVELSVSEEKLIKLTEELTSVINERIFWLRSSGTLFHSRLGPDTWNAFQWLVDGKQWSKAGTSLVGPTENRLAIGIAVLIAIPWFLLQRRLRTRIRVLGEEVSRNFTRTIAQTMFTVLFTVIISLLWPALLFFVGLEMVWSVESNRYSRAIGLGMQATAVVYLLAELYRQICRPGGLAAVHFRWKPGTLQVLRHTVYWMMAFGLPLVFLVVAIDYQSVQEHKDSLGRLAFVIGMGILALITHHVLRPNGALAQEATDKYRDSWIARSWPFWHIVSIAMPVTLAILAIVGYYYTALQLAWRLQFTVWLVLGLTVVNALLFRWLYAARGKLAIQQAQKKREEADGSNETEPATGPAGSVDLAAVNLQTRKLLHAAFLVLLLSGLWLTWADVLPALGVLHDYKLWSQTDGATTLADLGLAVIVAILASIAGRNVPGLLEITILQRLPLDAGGRHALLTFVRYLISVVGIALFFGLLGVRWSNVQWLVAAMTVGLGFGLQEIFANFVSGLILLFERPIRVGDVVTVGDISGVVSEIRIRATTITNWDRRELIVPNKEFITGRLLNWTLTDQVNRVVVNVGIAYGANTELAYELLQRVAVRHPLILQDPAPVVSFEEFGASSLNFVLRCFLPDLENRTRVIHELHMTIEREFRNHGIEIAFPQQDVHIRSVHQPFQIVRAFGDMPRATAG